MNKMALYRLVVLVLPVVLLASIISPIVLAQQSQGVSTWRIHSRLLRAVPPTGAVAATSEGALLVAVPRLQGRTMDAGGIPPQVGLAPYSLPPRNALGFFGSGFPANTWVDVLLGNLDGIRPIGRYSIWLGRAVTNAGGNLNGQVEVPLLPAGDYPVYFVPVGSQDPVVANLIIQALKPWVVLDEYAPSVHDWMGFAGRDFAPDEEVLIYLNERSGQPVAHVQADSYGNFTLNRVWQVPDLTGQNTLIFVGKDSGTTFSAQFTMMPPPPPAQPQPTPAPPQLHRSPARGVEQQISMALAAPHLSPARRLALQASDLPVAPPPLAAHRSSASPGGTLLGAPSTLLIGLLLLGVWLILVLLLSVVLMVRRGEKRHPEKAIREEVLPGYENSSPQAGPVGLLETPSSLSSPLSLAAPPESGQPVSFCPRCGWPYVAGGTPHPPFATQSPPPAVSTQPRKTPIRSVIHREMPTTLGMWASAASDRGRKRAGRENEDNFLAVRGTRKDRGSPQPFGLFVVADGMGGRANGHDASRVVIETVFHYLAPSLISDDLTSDDLVLLLEEAIQSANEALYRHNQQGNPYMGCTVTTALVTGNEALICNVGDSRTYLLTPQRPLRRVTVDHSIVESLVAAGAIQRDDVYTHPRRDRIYRSLGQRLLVQIDTFREPLGPGDELLLCCDGLWELVRDPEIERIMRHHPDVRQASSKLIERANENGGDDNITAIVIRLTDELKPARRPGIEQIDAGPADLSRPGFAGSAAGKKP